MSDPKAGATDLDLETLGTAAPAAEAVVETVEDDPDKLRLQEAEAELAAEEEAARKAQGDGGDAAQPEAQEAAADTEAAPAGQGGDQAGGAPARMIPIERLNQESGKRKEAEDSAAYWRGRAEAFEAVQGAGKGGEAAEPPAPQLSPQDQIKALRKEQLDNAAKFDAGEISAVELEQRRAEADDKIADIRTSSIAREVDQKVHNPANSEWLAQRTAEIEQQYPVLSKVTRAEAFALAEIAQSEMAADGKPFREGDLESIYELRTRTAELAEHNFGHRIPEGQRPAPAAGTQPPAKAATPPRPGVTPAQRLAKENLAARMPPDLTTAGRTATTLGFTEAQILAMTTEDIEKLSPEQRQALEEGRF